MHPVLIDLRRILRAGGKMPLVVILIAICALAWAAFGTVSDQPSEAVDIVNLSGDAREVKVMIGGVVPGVFSCNSASDHWAPYPDEASGMKAMGQMIDYLIVCRSDTSAELVAKNTTFDLLVGAGFLHLGGAEAHIEITGWKRDDAGPGSNAILAAIWAALAMLMVIPVRITAFLVFQERTSGRLEWILANQVSVQRYACNKSAASTLGATGLLLLLWGCILALGIAFMKFALLSSSTGAAVYEQSPVFMGEVVARGASAMVSAGGNLAAVSFATSVLAVRLFLSSRFQLRITTLMEMLVMFVALLPLAFPQAPQWVPLFGAFASLQSSLSGDPVAWGSLAISVGISVVLGLAALIGIHPRKMFSK